MRSVVTFGQKLPVLSTRQRNSDANVSVGFAKPNVTFNGLGFRVVSTPRLELRQEIAAGKAKSPGTEPGLPTSSCATRAGESPRSESSSHHRDLGIQPAVVLCCSETFAALGLVRDLRQTPICFSQAPNRKQKHSPSRTPRDKRPSHNHEKRKKHPLQEVRHWQQS